MSETKKFKGKTEGFKDKKEKSFYQRMLKAYLNGNEYFHFGYEYFNKRRLPKRHKVEYSFN